MNLNQALFGNEIRRLIDRRHDTRNPVNLVGQIDTDQWMPVECKILDVSDSGAKLETFQSLRLPNLFELRVPLEGFLFPVRQAWRKGRIIGVEFTAEPKLYREELF